MRHDTQEAETPHSPMLTERQAAKMLRCSVRNLQRLRTEGGGPKFVKISDRRLAYLPEDLSAWIAARRVGAAISASSNAQASAPQMQGAR